MPDFKDTIKNLPHLPGVYRFFAMDDVLLYIGKAKDLKNRVSSYFQGGRIRNQRLTLMISQIQRIEYTVVATETESLILEANLIQNLQPKYNILLKDDKSYVYVRITAKDPIPGIFLTRRKYDPSSSYFGPYTERSDIFQTLRTIRTIFPYCQERFVQKRPCSYYGIKQCDGICAGMETKDDYLQKINQIKNVLSGKTKKVEDFLKEKINSAVDIFNFELAGMWRDRLESLTQTVDYQKVVLPNSQDLDIITLITEQTPEGLQMGSFFVQNIRDGKIVNVNNFLLSGTEEQDTTESDFSKEIDMSPKNLSYSILQRFLSSYYALKDDHVQVLIQAFEVKKS